MESRQRASRLFLKLSSVCSRKSSGIRLKMARIGYALQRRAPPNDLVRYARLAEEAGFEFAMVSDHYHPWVDQQGQSPFVWSVIGGVAQVTEDLPLGTGVTCPLIRIHPAIIAHAAATASLRCPAASSSASVVART